MGTTLADDVKRFDKLAAKFPGNRQRRGSGALVFAGSYWPAANAPGARMKRFQVEEGIREARAMIVRGVTVAKAGLRGDAEAAALMTRWFGPRPAPAPLGERDWWAGAARILGVVESFITSNVNVYYRGDDSLLGRPDDYPGAAGKLTAQDLGGYAESSVGTMDNVIGLCKLFFRRTGNANRTFTMKLFGYDSVGGTLVHELSHNLCKSDDHDAPNGGTCYGTAACLALAAQLPRRAWYNADNLEYFCEQAWYKL